jgi:hypothetical protein
MLPSLLPFEKLPVTLLVLGCYLAAIISTVLVQERLPAVPQQSHDIAGLNLNEAWRDLKAESKTFLDKQGLTLTPLAGANSASLQLASK